MMNAFVTENEFSSDISIVANTTQYRYGEAVEIQVIANGDRYVKGADAPKGVFVAIQVDFTGADGQAQGQFHDLSPDLELTPNCPSSAYSKTAGGAFSGKASLLWTPTHKRYMGDFLRTTGNATFKLIWSNGPGSSDPLVSKTKRSQQQALLEQFCSVFFFSHY